MKPDLLSTSAAPEAQRLEPWGELPSGARFASLGTEAAVIEVPAPGWDSSWRDSFQHRLTELLESGAVLAFPHLEFRLEGAERALLDPRILAKSKNVSFDPATEEVGGTSCTGEEAYVLAACLRRFSQTARSLIAHAFPLYAGALQVKRTSLRPAEIAGRKSSWRKDDTLLHVDAFPSQPTRGMRILRVFSNVNPVGKPRVWRLGESFENVARRFLPRVRPPLPGSARLLYLLHATKSLRSEYDHYMLGLHDAMKADQAYQSSMEAIPSVSFAPGTTWVAYVDSVSHAALSGQHQLEQSFLIPVGAMQTPERSPLRILERLCGSRRLAIA
jgi:hypothetical protein